ncbi:MAG: LytTR family DNA-binding domain-containing protein [Ignavibacteria bacterium]|nr:LytTR family DNA-binding domain-containing protein [Ignavibacteria bacterium]
MSAKFKVVLVDDEELARMDLKRILLSFPEIEVIGEADTVASAVQVIKTLHPNLIFLDIQMPGESGFDLIEKIDFPVNIIFVTAFDKYALRAFDVNAMDYLLKPVNPERLQQAIEKLEDKPAATSGSQRKLEVQDVLFLQLGDKYQFLRIDTISAITSNADYTFVHTTDGKKKLSKKTMKEWEARLPENHFARIHRETIVNLGSIANIEEWFYSSFKVHINGIESPFIMSRRYAAKIKDIMG